MSRELTPIQLRPVRLVPLRGAKQPSVNNPTAYFKEVCRAAGVPWWEDVQGSKKVYHVLGSFHVSSVDKGVDEAVWRYTEENDLDTVYSFSEYLDACRRVRTIEGQVQRLKRWMKEEEIRHREYEEAVREAEWNERAVPVWKEKLPPDMPTNAELVFLEHYHMDFMSPDREGYLIYLRMVAEPLYNAVLSESVPLLLEENPDRPHAYVCGTSGSGKSELLKIMVHTYVTNRDYGSVVVLDPSSDFVGEMARWRDFHLSNRLVFIRPTLAKGKSPTINPFEIAGVRATDYSEEALEIKRVVAQELVEALGRIVTDEAGAGLTGPMRTILRNCVMVLLDRENASLDDLLLFMQDSDNRKLMEFAQGLKHHRNVPEYFKFNGRFQNKSNTATKEAIARKLDGLLSIGPFAEMTCGKSTINLEQAINDKKVVLFDLGKGAIGRDEGKALGRLIIAMLLGIAFRREKVPMKDRVPCALVVDECQNFVTESMEEILRETRKYRLMLTLGQQTAGQRMTPNLKDTVYQNANLQMIGGSPKSGANKNAELVGVTGEQVMRLKRGEFYVRPKRAGDVLKFRTRTDLLKKRNSVGKFTWRRTVKKQIRMYYGSKEKTKPPIKDDVNTDGTEW